ncbi:hypothetical protein CYMTET_43023 [Cymbomonas tetramitiformis]|uniref:Uncharacterized protein n=1 Tax=Cymbomonas tetramitiformis TaxID=36881 RepID=A0AAE0C311_9CHLO|nr:hypothetical protein CYMTET_43023 [Cymbomonas tetramitiformis]
MQAATAEVRSYTEAADGCVSSATAAADVTSTCRDGGGHFYCRGAAALAAKVSVHQNQAAQHCAGEGEACVVYDDGNEETLNLAEETFRLLENGEVRGSAVFFVDTGSRSWGSAAISAAGIEQEQLRSERAALCAALCTGEVHVAAGKGSCGSTIHSFFV